MASHIERRKFLATRGGAAADAGGWVSQEHDCCRLSTDVTAFRQGLSEAGFIEGQNQCPQLGIEF
jgi:hypothetical protein